MWLLNISYNIMRYLVFLLALKCIFLHKWTLSSDERPCVVSQGNSCQKNWFKKQNKTTTKSGSFLEKEFFSFSKAHRLIALVTEVGFEIVCLTSANGYSISFSSWWWWVQLQSNMTVCSSRCQRGLMRDVGRPSMSLDKDQVSIASPAKQQKI